MGSDCAGIPGLVDADTPDTGSADVIPSIDASEHDADTPNAMNSTSGAAAVVNGSGQPASSPVDETVQGGCAIRPDRARGRWSSTITALLVLALTFYIRSRK
jgi:hypothetical protein